MKNKLETRIAKETLIYLNLNKWESIGVKSIYKRLKGNKKKFYNIIKDKNDLLININRYFDNEIINKSNLIEDSDKKDMIFEVIMMRFDLLNLYKPSIINIFNFFKKNPKFFFSLLPSFIKSIKIMSKIAKIETKGMLGKIKIKGLLVIYFATFLIWIKEKNHSLDKTMTKLDSYLINANNFLKIINR
tara:strand:+ start:118 stop:681 length:564 start_codon:yes stop_codon:yes gene_type:complete